MPSETRIEEQLYIEIRLPAKRTVKSTTTESRELIWIAETITYDLKTRKANIPLPSATKTVQSKPDEDEIGFGLFD